MADERGAVFIGPAGEEWPGGGEWVSIGVTNDFAEPTRWELAGDPAADLEAAIGMIQTQGEVTVTIPVDGEAILKAFREAAAQAVAAREAARVPYLRDANLPDGTILAFGPALTGHDRNVLVIPTGERGDQILDGIRANGGNPVPWTPAEIVATLPALTFGSPPSLPEPGARDWLRYSGA